MSTLADLVVVVNSLKDTMVKIGSETESLKKKIDELNALIAAGGVVTPELQAAMDALVAQVKVVDDLVPDVAPPAPPVA